jgi:hypothetical protein
MVLMEFPCLKKNPIYKIKDDNITTRIPNFFTRNFGKKKTHFGRASKKPLNHFGQIILNLSIATRPCTF